MKKATRATLAIAAFCVLAIALTWLIVRWVRRRRYARMSWAREGMNAKLAARIRMRRRKKGGDYDAVKNARMVKSIDCPKSKTPDCPKYSKAECVKNGKLVDMEGVPGQKRDQFAWRCKTYQEYCNTNKNNEFYDENKHECTNTDPGGLGTQGNAGKCNWKKGLMKAKDTGKCVPISVEECSKYNLWYSGNNGKPKCVDGRTDDTMASDQGKIGACQANNNNNNKNWWNNDLGKCVANPNAPNPPPL